MSKSMSASVSEKDVVLKVLNKIDSIAEKYATEGFNRKNFAVGVLNCFLICFTFGRFPQHFWFLTLGELLVLLPMRIHYSCHTKPLQTFLYYLDYCWMMNFSAIFILLVLLQHAITGSSIGGNDEVRYQLFLTFYGVSCGPLLAASVVLPFVAIIFHDYRIMTGTFIHILPTMVMYTFMWHSDAIREAWPRVLNLSYLEDVNFLPEDKFFIVPGTHLGTVAGNSLALYVAWWVPYVFWQVVAGMDLPRKNRVDKDGKPIIPKYDTVFHSTVRKGLCIAIGKTFWGRPKAVSKKQMENDDYELRDFLLYMTFHAIGIYLSVFFLAYPCYRSQTFHEIVMVLLVVLVVARGGDRYTYYVTRMYEKAIRKEFGHVLVD